MADGQDVARSRCESRRVGADSLTRTDDLPLTKRLLYQLSYAGVLDRIRVWYAARDDHTIENQSEGASHHNGAPRLMLRMELSLAARIVNSVKWGSHTTEIKFFRRSTVTFLVIRRKPLLRRAHH
jgi:hypothetical protein